MSDCGYDGNERRSSPTCQYSEDSAKKAVKDVFAILGVDIDSPKEVREFQESLRFGDFLRKAANRSVFALVGTIAVLATTAMFYGFISKIKGEW